MKLYNSTGDTTTTTGTGALTGAGTAPDASYQTPTAAGVANGDVIVIRIADGSEWEVCESTVTVATGVYTYSRGALLASSTGSRINFSAGTKNIYIAVAMNSSGKLHGDIVTEYNFSFTDVTTADVSTTKHGLVPKAPNNTSQWLRGDGGFAIVPGRLLSISVLTSTSSSTYTTPAGCNKIFIRMVGGGGAGGSADGNTSQCGVGGGGHNGAYLEKLVTVTPSTGYTYQCGTAGTAGSAGNNSGNAGGNSTISINGTTYTAGGGGGGNSMAAGTSVTATSVGTFGSATNGDINVDGANGQVGLRLSGTAGLPGRGGASQFGAGGYNTSTTQAAGQAGTGYGSGGGGAVSNTTTDTAGGAGKQGVIIIMEYT